MNWIKLNLRTFLTVFVFFSILTLFSTSSAAFFQDSGDTDLGDLGDGDFIDPCDLPNPPNYCTPGDGNEGGDNNDDGDNSDNEDGNARVEPIGNGYKIKYVQEGKSIGFKLLNSKGNVPEFVQSMSWALRTSSGNKINSFSGPVVNPTVALSRGAYNLKTDFTTNPPPDICSPWPQCKCEQFPNAPGCGNEDDDDGEDDAQCGPGLEPDGQGGCEPKSCGGPEAGCVDKSECRGGSSLGAGCLACDGNSHDSTCTVRCSSYPWAKGCEGYTGGGNGVDNGDSGNDDSNSGNEDDGSDNGNKNPCPPDAENCQSEGPGGNPGDSDPGSGGSGCGVTNPIACIT